MSKLKKKKTDDARGLKIGFKINLPLICWKNELSMCDDGEKVNITTSHVKIVCMAQGMPNET